MAPLEDARVGEYAELARQTVFRNTEDYDHYIARLKKLQQDTGATVVLSSTWRHDREGLASAKR